MTGRAGKRLMLAGQRIASLFMIELRRIKRTNVELFAEMFGVAFDTICCLIGMKSFVDRNLRLEVFVTCKTLDLQHFFLPSVANVAIFYSGKFLMRFGKFTGRHQPGHLRKTGNNKKKTNDYQPITNVHNALLEVARHHSNSDMDRHCEIHRLRERQMDHVPVAKEFVACFQHGNPSHL
jgi:hypothetical protein